MDVRSTLALEGYLLVLRRLSGNRCDFWAEEFDSDSGVEVDFRNHLSSHDVALLDSSPIGYKEMDLALEEHCLSKLNIKNKSLLKLFAWDIIEYIKMSFRYVELGTGPIFSSQAILINAESKFHGRYVYIFIPVHDKGVALGLATRA